MGGESGLRWFEEGFLPTNHKAGLLPGTAKHSLIFTQLVWFARL